MRSAVAVDFGASSGRIAVGSLREGQIHSRLSHQVAHDAKVVDGHLRWNFELLSNFVKAAADIAKIEGAATLGIDCWGVDHGFLDGEGHLIAAPVCYRDLSHLSAFELLAPHRELLYRLTGIQHQPFNTLCQLYARRTEDPALIDRAKHWLLLPDLLGFFLTGELSSEITEASTTQLLSHEGKWSNEVFDLIGWPIPNLRLNHPGEQLGTTDGGVKLIAVGSHDTASAVAGFGTLKDSDLFLNVGTWSLCGTVLEKALISRIGENLGFTNERTVDGKIRYLKNIPGFYFINRLHSDLAISESVPLWLSKAKTAVETIDLFAPEFFNPESMLETCKSRLAECPQTAEEWAGVALSSLGEAVAKTANQIADLTGRSFTSLKVGGGGSQSKIFCQSLADRIGIRVLAGPAEATVLGNLAVQFLGQGAFTDWTEMYRVVDASIGAIEYMPR